MSTGDALYEDPAAMEPLLPQTLRPQMAERTCEIFRKSGELTGQIPAAINRERIAALIREMNSYYSNLIEGHKTLPKDIEAALRKTADSNDSDSANQHLARAHIRVEEGMRKRLQSEEKSSVHSSDFLCELHREFYRHLPARLHEVKSENNRIYRVEPGMLRDFEVSVGGHQPPHHAALPDFMARLDRFFSSPQILATNQLVALAAAHHRLAWVHPFGDGNGRVIRLHSHAGLIRCHADGAGLWTLSRGLARSRAEYYRLLNKADGRRAHDYDGRGNLTDKGLAEFCLFFLDTMLDQICFMGELLQLHTLATRIERHLQFELVHLRASERERLGRLLRAALFEGEIERGQVREIIGTGDTVAREIINLAVKEELVDSRGPKSALALVFSAKNLETYFPKLYQDLPISEDH